MLQDCTISSWDKLILMANRPGSDLLKHCWVEQGLEMCGLIRVLVTLIYSWIFLSKDCLTRSAKRLQESSRARLQCVICKPHRMALWRFAMRSHCLCVETGRWRRPCPIPYKRRYCASCRKNWRRIPYVVWKWTLWRTKKYTCAEILPNQAVHV